MRPYFRPAVTGCGLFAGLLLTAWFVSKVGIAVLLTGFNAVGWGVLLVVIVRAAVIVINGVAWAQLLTRLSKVPLWAFVCIRWFRESADSFLPLAGISGAVIGARTLTFWNVRGALATASIVADLLLQTSAQALFALVGVILLWPQLQEVVAWPPIVAGAVATSMVLAGFYAFQRHGGAQLVDRAFVVISARVASARQPIGPGFHRAVENIWKGRAKFAVANLGLHVLAWSVGTLEVWITLHLLGWPISAQQALIIESLGTSVSSVAFFVPGSWGIQEGGFILIGQFLGLPVHASLLLSLVKRVPDLALGLPGLAVWYAVETKRLLLVERI
ncbi:MAG TPA: lysylphosphatidylglycerol synthase domain-containing protein [Xanthobacteraceae bacterium]|nr:lysylphosphatidylglycerol synthase domain-containing protein [Xanthobacteraceae bacterium]